jgi:hypothetical protein
MGSRALLTFSVVAVKMATGFEVGASAADRMAMKAPAANNSLVENKLGIGAAAMILRVNPIRPPLLPDWDN